MRHITRFRNLFAGGGALVLALLIIEFIDEFFFGAMEAAWPLIRDDLSLTYVQIGLLLSLPRIWGSVAGVVIGILGDVWNRRAIIIGGGALFAVSLLVISTSVSFTILMVGLLIFNPSSGAFVGLSQSTLMDHDTTRYEQNMARWTFAGASGVALGALALGGALTLGMGWRELVLATAAVSALALLAVLKLPLGGASRSGGSYPTFGELRSGVSGALSALLERVRGLTYLRYSALAELVLFIAFLLAPGLWPKLVIVALLGFGNAGWYPILQAQLYKEMPGKSGTVMAVNDVSSLVSGLVPLCIGLAARTWGLGAAIWLLLAGPIALLIGIPHYRSKGESS